MITTEEMHGPGDLVRVRMPDPPGIMQSIYLGVNKTHVKPHELMRGAEPGAILIGRLDDYAVNNCYSVTLVNTADMAKGDPWGFSRELITSLYPKAHDNWYRALGVAGALMVGSSVWFPIPLGTAGHVINVDGSSTLYQGVAPIEVKPQTPKQVKLLLGYCQMTMSGPTLLALPTGCLSMVDIRMLLSTIREEHVTGALGYLINQFADCLHDHAKIEWYPQTMTLRVICSTAAAYHRVCGNTEILRIALQMNGIYVELRQDEAD